jgi:hypothetical protein
MKWNVATFVVVLAAALLLPQFSPVSQVVAAPPRPLIYVLNPTCFPAGESTVIDVFGQNFGGKVSLLVNGKQVPTVLMASDPAVDGGLQHLQTTVTFPGVGYVNVQVRSQYGGNVMYSTPLAWSYVTSPIHLPDGQAGQPYPLDLSTTVPSVCAFRSKPWYQE